MRNSSALLSADGSPQSVQAIGVRRLNRVPLYIIGVVAAFLAVCCSLGWLSTRTNRQRHSPRITAAIPTPTQRKWSATKLGISRGK